MSRRPAPPVSYGDDLAIQTGPAPELPREPDLTSGRRPILDNSAPTLIYVHPAGKHQLRQYAVASGLKTKVHDLLIEALEEWGAKRGLSGPWRVPPTLRR